MTQPFAPAPNIAASRPRICSHTMVQATLKTSSKSEAHRIYWHSSQVSCGIAGICNVHVSEQYRGNGVCAQNDRTTSGLIVVAITRQSVKERYALVWSTEHQHETVMGLQWQLKTGQQTDEVLNNDCTWTSAGEYWSYLSIKRCDWKSLLIGIEIQKINMEYLYTSTKTHVVVDSICKNMAIYIDLAKIRKW